MAAIHAVITRGYGAPGSASLVITRGYGIAAVVPPYIHAGQTLTIHADATGLTVQADVAITTIRADTAGVTVL